MKNLVEDGSKNVAVFINDFFPELPPALEKLSKKLGRPIQGVMLVDKTAHSRGKYHRDKNQLFETIVCDFSDPAELRRTIKGLEEKLLLIDATSERSQPYFKLVVPHVPYLPTPTESSLEWATHKGQMRALVGAYRPALVPQVQVVRDDSEDTIATLLNGLRLPYIVKPTGLAASILVNKVSTETELRETLQHSFEVIHDIYARNAGRWEPEMIVEEFIEGDMYSIDAYVNDIGKVWGLPPIRSKTAHSLGMEGFYTYQNESYLEIDDTTVAAGQAAARDAIHALGLRSCVAHVELFHTASGWKIIELGPRPGGYRQFMYAAAYGIDHAYNELLLKIGLEPEIPTKAISYSLITNTYAEEEGTVEAIEGVETARALGSVSNLWVHAKPGDLASPSGKGGDLIVDSEMSNTSQEQLLADADKLRELIKIRTKQPAKNLIGSRS
ncbi:MAG TPA: ATP-grasp domain-containing protein [Candidatus Saccharimonadales bacterium]|nr:ATP-grasp domain-containing protein [Candidatus Saccharimonadales bacterium]